MIYTDVKCSECGSNKSRNLDCEEHGRNCPLIICCKCGATVTVERKIK